MPKSPKQTDQLPHSLVRQKTVSSTSKVTSTSKENNEPAPAAFKFNKEKWVATLTDEQKDLLKLEIDTLHESQDIPFNTVKAVIIGQDPYHNFNQAHGLCFSPLQKIIQTSNHLQTMVAFLRPGQTAESFSSTRV
ncbi:hypothetical protein DID88_008960 [Monilinia fructigena]|uniref:Uracil-DNA glycosylase-like domain-containing protein n=1 Tax=Monilinia fructigena TaxID=38457 RepID=A0A395J7F5_9HELO|nr:hypothetical protein DID88_008960 [Monilinia fructigena]